MSASRGEDGYRREAVGGPRVRTDVVDVYVFRRTTDGGVEFLQLSRAREPLKGTWQPLMAHVEAGETAAQCALREMEEEIGLRAGDAPCRGVWALQGVHPYYLAALDAIVMSPRFAAEVAPDWSPILNDEHTDARWVAARDVNAMFMWTGQKLACREVVEEIVRAGSLAAERLRVG